MRYLLIALAALFVSEASAQEATTYEPIYIGSPTHNRFISVCMDSETALRVVAEQQENGARAAQELFFSTGVCFAMHADFVALRQIAEFDMGTHKVRIIEIGSLADPKAQHLYVITESPLYDGITA